jgi:hypothetical protein
MFKLSQKTVRRFSFAEVLLMVAINEVEKRKVGSSPVKPAAKIKRVGYVHPLGSNRRRTDGAPGNRLANPLSGRGTADSRGGEQFVLPAEGTSQEDSRTSRQFGSEGFLGGMNCADSEKTERPRAGRRYHAQDFKSEESKSRLKIDIKAANSTC